MNKKKKFLTVLSAGHFDPFPHRGHIHHFEKAKKLGNWLIVAVNSDEDCRKKHDGLCYMPQEERMLQVGALKPVDEVIPAYGNDGTMTQTILKVKPDLFAKGGDRTPDNMPQSELDACKKVGCRIVYGVGRQENSSSSIIQKILYMSKEWFRKKFKNEANTG
jgi:D-beta-D-heptose 7-phosphate kinase/D-beta-D-heptose 1-phosphate adenosyltransferase